MAILRLKKRRLMPQTGTDYGPYLANEPSPLHTTTIVDRCTEKLVDDWNKMRANVRPPTPCSLPRVLFTHLCSGPALQ